MTRKIEMILTHILLCLLGIPALIIGMPIYMLSKHMIKVATNQQDSDVDSALTLTFQIWSSPIKTLKTIWTMKD